MLNLLTPYFDHPCSLLAGLEAPAAIDAASSFGGVTVVSGATPMSTLSHQNRVQRVLVTYWA